MLIWNTLLVWSSLVFKSSNIKENNGRFETLRPIIIEKLLEAFSGIRGVKVT